MEDLSGVIINPFFFVRAGCGGDEGGEGGDEDADADE